MKKQNKLAGTKQNLAAFSFIDLDKAALLKVISTVQYYQLQANTLLTNTQKQALREQSQIKLQQELSQTLSPEQRALAVKLLDRFVATEAERQ